MAELHEVIRKVSQARLREFLTRTLWLLSYALPIWAALAAVVIVLQQFVPQAYGLWTILLIVSGGVALLMCVVYGLLGLSRHRLARLIDRRADLKDRLTNALEFSARDTQTPLMTLAVADAREQAERVDVKRHFPLWTPGTGKRLAALAFLLPLVYAVAALNLAAWMHKEEPKSAIDAIQIPEELADDGLRDLPPNTMMLPAVRGLQGLFGSWRQRLAELRERAQAAMAAIPQEEPELPETIYREDMARDAAGARRQEVLALDGLPAVRFDNELHLSDLRALGDVDAEIDSSMATAFSQLDEYLFDEDPNIQNVEEYIEKIEKNSSEGMAAASMMSMQSNFAAQGSTDNDAQGAFRNATQGAQQQSFNEFLNEYAKHLGRVAQKKQDVNKQRAQQRGQQPGKVKVLSADQGQQVPEDAEWRMVKMTPEMQNELKMNMQMGDQVEQGNFGGSRAGRGGGTFRGAIKVKHEELANAKQKDAVQGQIGEGQSSVQILEDADPNAMQTYGQIYNSYKQEALQLINDATIPLSIRSYVQRYLQSINPAALGPAGASTPNQQNDQLAPPAIPEPGADVPGAPPNVKKAGRTLR